MCTVYMYRHPYVDRDTHTHIHVCVGYTPVDTMYFYVCAQKLEHTCGIVFKCLNPRAQPFAFPTGLSWCTSGEFCHLHTPKGFLENESARMPRACHQSQNL